MLLGSFIIYYFEGDAQPEKFSSIGVSMYWAFVTVTTVGYGDMHPVSIGGKVTACVFSCIGVLVIALPSSLLSSSFVTVLKKKKNRSVLHAKPDTSVKTASHGVLDSIASLEQLALLGNREALHELAAIHERSGKALRRSVMSD